MSSLLGGVAQAAGDPAGAASVEGVQAGVTLLAFLVVMLVVPWLLAGDPSETEVGKRGAASRRPGRFASRHERRLWAGALVVVAAIFSTLAPAAELAAALRARNLLRLSMAVVLAVVTVAVAVPWLRRRPSRFEIGAGVAIFAVYLTTLIRIPVPEARSHLFEYGVLAMLVHQALTERRRGGRTVPAPAVLAVSATASIGWLDEAVQALLPSRTYDLRDVAFNALAAAMAVTAVWLMGWARRLGRRWRSPATPT